MQSAKNILPIMKREYYKSLYTYQLHILPPNEVLRSSIDKIRSYSLLNRIIKKLSADDLAEFIEILTETDYDLDMVDIYDVLHKHSFTKDVYERFLELRISKLPQKIPFHSFYNYLYYKKRTSDLNIDFITDLEIKKLHKNTNSLYRNEKLSESMANFNSEMQHLSFSEALNSGDIDSLDLMSDDEIIEVNNRTKITCIFENMDEDQRREMCVLIKKIFIANIKKIFIGNIFTDRNTVLFNKLVDFVRSDFKEPLLIAMIDCNGRINSSSYGYEDINLVPIGQSYCNSEDYQKRREHIKSLICRNRHADSSSKFVFCDICNCYANMLNYQPAPVYDQIILNGDIEALCMLVRHDEKYVNERVLKILLKKLKDENTVVHRNTLYNANRRQNNHYWMNIVDTLKMFYAFDSTMFSYVKSLSDDSTLIFHLADFLISSEDKRYHFALFMKLFLVYRKSVEKKQARKNSYITMKCKNILFVYKQHFERIVDILIPYFICNYVDGIDHSLYDKEFIEPLFEDLAAFSNYKASDFVHKFMFYIFRTLYSKHPVNFTESFVSRYSSHLIAYKILQQERKNLMNGDISVRNNRILEESQHEAKDTPMEHVKIESSDVLVILLFDGYFISHPDIFADNRIFIQSNITQILFKIKMAHINSAYPQNTCIYRILQYLLGGMPISSFFSYIWPSVEYFLNHVRCACSEMFIEWLKALQYSPVMVPYLSRPFENIEDIPVLPSVGTNIYEILSRYFFAESGSKGTIKDTFSSFYLCAYRNNLTAQKLYSDKHNEDISNRDIISNEVINNTDSIINRSINNRSISNSDIINNSDKSNTDILNNTDIMNKKSIWMQMFLMNYRNNLIFRNKIKNLYFHVPLRIRGLIGDIDAKHPDEHLFECSTDATSFMIEKFLVNIDYSQQDLFGFVLQEFIKNRTVECSAEILDQFRHSKYVLDFSYPPVDGLSIESHRAFLEYIFKQLIASNRRMDHFKYLVLFDDTILEYAALCLIHHYNSSSLQPNIDDQRYNRDDCTDERYNKEIFTFIQTATGFVENEISKRLSENKEINKSLMKIIRFLIKIENFRMGVKKYRIVETQQLLLFILLAEDYQAIVYLLDTTENSLENGINDNILKLAYYRLKDYSRLRGIGRMEGVLSHETLFFEFCMERNFKAAKECLAKIENIMPVDEDTPDRNLHVLFFKNLHALVDGNSSTESSTGFMEYLECMKVSDEVYEHVKTDYELLSRVSTDNDINNSSINNNIDSINNNIDKNSNIDISSIDKDNNSIKNNNIDGIDCIDNKNKNNIDSIDLIHGRRINSPNKNLILKFHRKMCFYLNIPAFTVLTEIEYIKYLRSKGEHGKCIESISNMLLKDHWEVLYEYCLVKIQQKDYGGAKILVNRLITNILHSNTNNMNNHHSISNTNNMNNHHSMNNINNTVNINSIRDTCSGDGNMSNSKYPLLFYKANLKLCEINKSRNLYFKVIERLEKDLEIEPEASLLSASGKFVSSKRRVIYNCSEDNAPEIALTENSNNYNMDKSINNNCNSINTSIKNNYSINNNYNINNSRGDKIRYLQRIYFLTARHIEGTSLIRALHFYYRAFSSNYEAVPRFFHLLCQTGKTEMKEARDLVERIVRDNLHDLLPYYGQISNKLGISNTTAPLYCRVIQSIMDRYPYDTFWNTLLYYNSKNNEIKSKVENIVEGFGIEKRILFRKIEEMSSELRRLSEIKDVSESEKKHRAADINDKDMNNINNKDINNNMKINMHNNVNDNKDMNKNMKINIQGDTTWTVLNEIRKLLPSEINIPGKKALLVGIKDEIIEYRSLQRPKKIVFYGDDGAEYPMMVKAKDDLRKDSRFMELNLLMNKIFAKLRQSEEISSPERLTREHYYEGDLYIRLYNVIPFTVGSGIMEFITNLESLKTIFCKYYTDLSVLTKKYCKFKKMGAANAKLANEEIKPVLHRHWKEVHYNEFYVKRERYIKTYAIMCVVGWFMGLGDRHAENIHFDKQTGDTVHVDLNCIFEKGKTFDVGEKVPFRLTKNIIDGMGIMGLEGTFRETMVQVFEIMSENKDVILSNMLSFVFDPLYEWGRKLASEPKRVIEEMENKLKIEDYDEKVEALVNEATDTNNLGAMYVGWMAFV
ncbi:serine/threonine-protein kinase ATR [Enteropsectra breve]|nr:serine/threonine-protein kinase ATR [Enteropsectra breve]